MKAWITRTTMTVFFLAVVAGCQHRATMDDVAPVGNGNPSSGIWVVSNFTDQGSVMTSHLAGYTFDFRADGLLSVNTGLAIISGTWRTKSDDDKQKFIITIPGANSMLKELEEDWEIITNAPKELQLKHDHSSHQMEVTFTKG